MLLRTSSCRELSARWPSASLIEKSVRFVVAPAPSAAARSTDPAALTRRPGQKLKLCNGLPGSASMPLCSSHVTSAERSSSIE